ncbi:MAG TPA: NACHT domain-containing protein [Duganella sp.]|nr:NACHT domain-containing protein [Duganella sp.]
MLNNLTSSHRLALSFVAIFIVALIGSFLFLPTIQVIALALLTFVLLIFIRPLLMPPGAGATAIQLVSLAGIFGLASSHSLWENFINTAIRGLAAEPSVVKAAPWLADIHWTDPSVAVMVFAAYGVTIVNYFLYRRSIGSDHPVPLKKDFPDPGFANKLQSFCTALNLDLVTTDRQANWSPDYYTELEAEVEIGVPNSTGTSRKRIAKLQTALRSDKKTKAFLVLGEPGGGKSVALRKLALDMLAEVGVTGRIPLYINLREWLPSAGKRDAQWTEQHPPTMEDLESFVLEKLKGRGDVFPEEFLDTYFRDLWQHGRLFFIFDSFDEIPELLDAEEESWLIDKLSELLCRFISGHKNAKGVLASRHFRRPTQAFVAQKILDIRPMSEDRIVKSLRRYPGFTPELQNQLLRDRHDLVPIARNPFLMALLGEWVRVHHTLPKTQADLYDNYLHTRLTTAGVSAKIKKQGLTTEAVIESATQIASFVFNSPAYGLEAPVAVLKNESSINHAEATIGILSHARLARETSGDASSFAFVHRRFLEYFVTTRMLDSRQDLPLEHIPSDSRGRDAMVLYAQLCDDDTAKRIAQFCWTEINTYLGNKATQLRAIHSLRFLTDAFLARKAAVKPFASELKTFIVDRSAGANGLLEAKICLEATGLLENAEAVPILQLAMSGANYWLRDTAFRACRHLPQISAELQNLIDAYVIKMPVQTFWKMHRALLLSLALSDSLRGAYQIALWRTRNLIASATAIALGWLIAPRVALLVTMALAFTLLIDALIQPVLTNILPARAAAAFKASPKKMFPPGTAFRFYQHFFGLSLLLVLALAMLLPHPGNRASVVSAITIFSDQALHAAYPALLALALLSFDWLLIHSVKSALIRFMRLPFREKLKLMGQIVLLLVAVSGFLYILASILSRIPPHIITAVFNIFVAMVALAIVVGLFKEAVSYYKDRQAFKHVVITDRMTRAQIAKALGLVQRKSLRLTAVRKIIELKTTVSGEWPDGFALNQLNDDAVTELAQMEERWLKLDR